MSFVEIAFGWITKPFIYYSLLDVLIILAEFTTVGVIIELLKSLFKKKGMK